MGGRNEKEADKTICKTQCGTDAVRLYGIRT